jgi:3-oxoacyl-[acyl-carrier-protein] synthase-3
VESGYHRQKGEKQKSGDESKNGSKTDSLDRRVIMKETENRSVPVRVVGTGSYYPGNPITNEDLDLWFGHDFSSMGERIGIKQRHWARDPKSGDLLEKNSEMATKAALGALENAGIDREEIDCIILSTATPDYPMPQTVCYVQEQMGILECPAIELRAACTGISQTLAVAMQFIKGGVFETILCIGTEQLTSILFPIKDLLDVERFINITMFADAAGAFVLQGGEGDGKARLLSSIFNSAGGGKPPGGMIPGGGSVNLITPESIERGCTNLFKHDFKATREIAPQLARRGLVEILNQTGIHLSKVSWIVPPVANPLLIETALTNITKEIVNSGEIPEGMEIDEKSIRRIAMERIFLNADRFGITGNASLYTAVDEANRTGRFRAGDIVILLPQENGKWVYGAIAFQWM